MKTVADIIDLWPSPAEFAEDVGLSSAIHARTMKSRGSIPQWYWDRVETAAARRGIKLSREDLQEAHAGKRQLGALRDPSEAA